MNKRGSTILKLVIIVSAFMFAHACYAQTHTANMPVDNNPVDFLAQSSDQEMRLVSELQEQLKRQEQMIRDLKERVEKKNLIAELQEKAREQDQVIKALTRSLLGQKGVRQRISPERKEVVRQRRFPEQRKVVRQEENPEQRQEALDEKHEQRRQVHSLRSQIKSLVDAQKAERRAAKEAKKSEHRMTAKHEYHTQEDFYPTQQANRFLNNASDLDYGSYGKQMNRQQMNRFGLNEGNIHLGKLEIHPSFHERLQWDDNIFKTSGTHREMEDHRGNQRIYEGKENDIMNIASPGVRLVLPVSKRILNGKIKRLGLNWQSDFISYADNAGQNQSNHYVNGSVTFQVLKGYDLTLNQNFSSTDVGAGSETDQLHERNTNSFGAGLRMSQLIHSLKKLDIEVKYNNFDQDYKETGLERANRTQHDYSFNVYYKLTPKIELNTGYTYTVINYDKSRDEFSSGTTDPLSDSHSSTLNGGITWKATARTTGRFNIGYTNREYEKDFHQGNDIDAAANWETSDTSSWIMNGGITTRLPWNTLLDVSFYRDLREAEFTAKSNSYYSSGGSLTLSNTFRKLSSDYTLGYFTTDFNGVNRADDIFFLAVNASYALSKWSQIEAGYSFRDKDTNQDFDRESEQINKAYIGFGIGL